VLTRNRYASLTVEQLAAALRELPGWSGDGRRLTRTVRPRDVWAFLSGVVAVEEELDHHTVATLDSGAVTFNLWTHACDAVTATDVELAQRLDALVRDHC
jgi:4a-hydroxytetrahydrobiopterin dehydratase